MTPDDDEIMFSPRGLRQYPGSGSVGSLNEKLSGYVERPRARTDERSLAVTLTPAGWRLRKEAEKIPAAIVSRLGMDVSELQHLHQELTRVIAAAKEANAT